VAFACWPGCSTRTEEIRPVRELQLDARWTLGRMLRKVMRGSAGRPKKNEVRAAPNFKAELERLNRGQRIGTLRIRMIYADPPWVFNAALVQPPNVAVD
jgi:hypothetical protein